MAKKKNTTANLGFEEKLWAAADKLRGHMDPSEYKHTVLGLIFLKYISDRFETQRTKLETEMSDSASPMFIKEAAARYETLEDRDIGKFNDDAMLVSERENPRLKGVLPKTFARPDLDKHLLGKLPYEVQEAIDLDSFRIQQTFTGKLHLEEVGAGVKGFGEAPASYTTENEKDWLSNIIKTLNDVHGVNLSDEDKLDIQAVLSKITDDEELQAVMEGDNTLENKKYKFESKVDEHILGFVHTKLDLYKKLTDPRVNQYFKRSWFDEYQGEAG